MIVDITLAIAIELSAPAVSVLARTCLLRGTALSHRTPPLERVTLTHRPSVLGAHVDVSALCHRFIKSTKDELRINGGLLAIDALIDVAAREDRVQLKLFANAITHISCYYCFSESSVLLAANTVAHLLAAADNLLATFVEVEARRALVYVLLVVFSGVVGIALPCAPGRSRC